MRAQPRRLAAQADADLIASYLPQPHADGSPIQPSELPTSLQGYLIRLTPPITLDGNVVATSTQKLLMGGDLLSTGGFTQLADPSQWYLTGEESNRWAMRRPSASVLKESVEDSYAH